MKRNASLLIVIALFPVIISQLAAQETFSSIDLVELRQSADDYRHRALLLRRSAAVRDRGISDAQTRADEIVHSAQVAARQNEEEAIKNQANAQNSQDTLNFAAGLLGHLPGGGFAKTAIRGGMNVAGNVGVTNANANSQIVAANASDAVAQAKEVAAPLREQSKVLAGDEKKLAHKADQYEKLADAKELLIAAETFRLLAEETTKSATENERAVAAARAFVEGMDF